VAIPLLLLSVGNGLLHFNPSHAHDLVKRYAFLWLFNIIRVRAHQGVYSFCRHAPVRGYLPDADPPNRRHIWRDV